MVLDAIRKRSGSLVVKLLFGLLLLSFVAWGVADYLRPQAQDSTVATVGDAAISAVELERQAETEIRRMRELLGARFDREQARALGLYNAVLARLIEEAVLDQAAQRAGLVITDAALRAEIEATPTFRGPLGGFERERFRQFLMAAGFTEASYIALLRRAMLRDVLIESAPVPPIPPRAAVEVLYRERAEKRAAETALVKDADQTAPAAPAEDEIVAFHRDNAARFTAPELRALTVARLAVDEIVRETAVSEDELRQAFAARAADFDLPERRRLRQMVFGEEAAALRAAEALKRGADFIETARVEAKMDAVSVELGLIARDQMPTDLADGVFALATGGVSAPLKSPLGWHIVQVVAVEPPQKRSLDDVRATLAKDLARDKAHDGLINLANRFEDALGGGASLEDAAAAVGVRIVKVAAIDTRGNGPDGKPVAGEGLPKLDLLAQVAFATGEGAKSPLTDMGDEGYFALRVDKVVAPQLKPLAEVRGEVLAAWRARKLTDLAKAEADRIAADARAENLKTAAAKRKLTATETGAIGRAGESPRAQQDAPLSGRAGESPRAQQDAPLSGRDASALPPPVLAALFGLVRAGEVAVVRVPEGYQVVRLVAVHPAEPAQDAAGVDKIAQELARAVAADLHAAFGQALRQDIPVKIRDANFDRLSR
jgi:peptidyl-prolyl cis-trans isomerase D